MDYNGNQNFISPIALADADTLTGSYATDNAVCIIDTKDINELTLFIFYTMGADETSNSIQIKIDTAQSDLAVDSVLWARETAIVTVNGTSTHTQVEHSFAATQAAATYDVFPIHLVDINAYRIRVSAKETGIAVNGGTFYLLAVTKGQ